MKTILLLFLLISILFYFNLTQKESFDSPNEFNQNLNPWYNEYSGNTQREYSNMNDIIR